MSLTMENNRSNGGNGGIGYKVKDDYLVLQYGNQNKWDELSQKLRKNKNLLINRYETITEGYYNAFEPSKPSDKVNFTKTLRRRLEVNVNPKGRTISKIASGYNISYSDAVKIWAELAGYKDDKSELIPVSQALSELNKETLKKEDIDKASEEAGVHYHSALSTWGAMKASGFSSLGKTRDIKPYWEAGKKLTEFYNKCSSIEHTAKKYGFTEGRTRELIETYMVFPNIEDWEAELGFTHHLICARTKNPAYWINYAKENKLSVRKLTNAIQQNNDQKDIEKPIEKPKECECETVNKDEDGHSIDCTNTTLCRWHMGEWYRSRCVEEGASITDLSKKCGLSCAEIREIIKTYRAFPEPKNRDSDLSYTHHRICANTTDPKGWLRKAKENNWSTRELSEVISGKPVNTIISLKQKIAELEAQLVEKDRQFAFITKEQSKNLPTTGHLFGLYQKITEQEQKIFALQKFNLVCLSSLQKKNASLLENARRAR